MKRKLILPLLTILMIFLTGCNSGSKDTVNSNYSFTDPDIAAYINGEPVYDSKKEQYIFMAKQFSQAIVDAGKESEVSSDNTDIYYQRMVKIASFSDADWDNEYYKTFLNDILIDEFVKDKDEFSEFMDFTVSQETEKAIEKIDLTIYNNSIISYGSIIEKVADRFDLPYDECVENIYKPFITDFLINDFLFGYYVKYKYGGQKTEWDGTNKDEYAAFLSDAYAKYDKYIEEQLNKSEIVLRPE